MTESHSSSPQTPIAVITMVQARDFPTAWDSLHAVDRQLGSTRHRFVLLNDDRNELLEASLAGLANTTVLVPGRNLGVAAGRNLLIRAALDSEAELIVSLDDDLLVPGDYLDRLGRRFDELRNREPRLGVFSPTVLDYGAVADLLSQGDNPVALDATAPAPSTEALRAALAAHGDPPLELIYHIGIRDWENHYLRSNYPRALTVRGFVFRAFGRDPQPGEAAYKLSQDPAIRQLIVADVESAPQRVDTVPGGVSAYSRRLVEAIGFHDERFSPFGYEDADFCIRAQRAGFRNYWLPTELVLHDLQKRSRERSLAELAYSLGRSRALLAANHGDGQQLLDLLLDTVIAGPAQLADLAAGRSAGNLAEPGPFAAVLIEYVAGFLGAAIKTGDDDDGTPRLVDRLAEHIATADPTAATFTAHSDAKDGTDQLEATWRGVRLGMLRPHDGAVPTEAVAHVAVAFSINRQTGAARIDPLTLDAPGFFTIRAALAIRGIGVHDRSGVAELEAFDLVVDDSRGLMAVETSGAWAAQRPTRGFLITLGRRLRGPTGKRVRGFLRVGRGPATLEVRAHPMPPVGSRELLALDTSPQRAKQRLGLRAKVLSYAAV